MARIAAGEPTKVPHRLGIHLVAARYGTTPEKVREWPAHDYLDACSFLGVTSA